MLLGNKVNGRICDLQVELAKPFLLEVLITLTLNLSRSLLTIGSRLVINHRDKGLVEVKEVSRACHQVRLDVCMGSLGRAIDPLTEVLIAVNVTLHPLLAPRHIFLLDISQDVPLQPAEGFDKGLPRALERIVISGIDNGLEGFEYALTVVVIRGVRKPVLCLVLYTAPGGDIKIYLWLELLGSFVAWINGKGVSVIIRLNTNVVVIVALSVLPAGVNFSSDVGQDVVHA